MTSEMMIVSIRRPRFKEKVMKQTFFEKLRKQEPIVYYELALDDEEDLEYGYCAYAFLLSVRKFMKEIGFENEWLTIVTPTFDIEGGFEFRFSKVDKEWLKQLPDPVESLRMLNQVKDIEERARMHSEEMLDFVQCIKRYLEENYVIYIDYTELQYIEVG